MKGRKWPAGGAHQCLLAPLQVTPVILILVCWQPHTEAHRWGTEKARMGQHHRFMGQEER